MEGVAWLLIAYGNSLSLQLIVEVELFFESGPLFVCLIELILMVNQIIIIFWLVIIAGALFGVAVLSFLES